MAWGSTIAAFFDQSDVDPSVWQSIAGAEASLYLATVFDEISVASGP